ncbi:MAG: ATP-binding protein [Planctomycetota bacterium]|jgi:CheY-like chemotaxis protein
MDISQLLDVSVSKKVELKRDLAENLPAVEADATQMRQVLMNLITNASEAIGDHSGTITIRTHVAEIGPEDTKDAQLNVLAEGRYVCLEVSDTGCGMDDETEARVFDPFFTTKFTGRGLGLAAVLGIVRGHRGAVKIISEPGKGTTFRILLPPIEEQAPGLAEAAEGESSAAWRGEGTVLLVDDEQSVRAIGKIMLERLGFTVLTAADGSEGLDVFRQHADRISAVLLDMTMPGLSGEEAFREMHEIRQDVPVLVCSGYSEDDAMSRFKGRGPAGFIQKPFELKTLIGRLRGALESGRPV